jgi:hypothetical protein
VILHSIFFCIFGNNSLGESKNVITLWKCWKILDKSVINGFFLLIRVSTLTFRLVLDLNSPIPIFTNSENRFIWILIFFFWIFLCHSCIHEAIIISKNKYIHQYSSASDSFCSYLTIIIPWKIETSHMNDNSSAEDENLLCETICIHHEWFLSGSDDLYPQRMTYSRIRRYSFMCDDFSSRYSFGWDKINPC